VSFLNALQKKKGETQGKGVTEIAKGARGITKKRKQEKKRTWPEGKGGRVNTNQKEVRARGGRRDRSSVSKSLEKADEARWKHEAVG